MTCSGGVLHDDQLVMTQQRDKTVIRVLEKTEIYSIENEKKYHKKHIHCSTWRCGVPDAATETAKAVAPSPDLQSHPSTAPASHSAPPIPQYG